MGRIYTTLALLAAAHLALASPAAGEHCRIRGSGLPASLIAPAAKHCLSADGRRQHHTMRRRLARCTVESSALCLENSVLRAHCSYGTGLIAEPLLGASSRCRTAACEKQARRIRARLSRLIAATAACRHAAGPSGQLICTDLCGDGVCAEIVCLAEGCPCAETPASCPADCR